MADFSKNTCPDKMIVLLQDTPLWAPQTPIFPILSAHLPPPISNFEIFENRPQNNIFHDFFKKSLKYLSDHLSDVLKWKYGPSAFQRTFSHEKILKTRQDTPFWSHVPKGGMGSYYYIILKYLVNNFLSFLLIVSNDLLGEVSISRSESGASAACNSALRLGTRGIFRGAPYHTPSTAASFFYHKRHNSRIPQASWVVGRGISTPVFQAYPSAQTSRVDLEVHSFC